MSAAGTRTPARTVLLVDDYPAMLAWAGRAFERAGWTVLTALDGPQAIARWTEARLAGTPVGVLVTDLEIPGLDGATLARTLRADDQELAVLVMHVGPRPDGAWHGPVPARTEFFEKPVRIADLIATAAALVDRADGDAMPARSGGTLELR